MARGASALEQSIDSSLSGDPGCWLWHLRRGDLGRRVDLDLLLGQHPGVEALERPGGVGSGRCRSALHLG